VKRHPLPDNSSTGIWHRGEEETTYDPTLSGQALAPVQRLKFLNFRVLPAGFFPVKEKMRNN
jgi:hypothetical protein